MKKMLRIGVISVITAVIGLWICSMAGVPLVPPGFGVIVVGKETKVIPLSDVSCDGVNLEFEFQKQLDSLGYSSRGGSDNENGSKWLMASSQLVERHIDCFLGLFASSGMFPRGIVPRKRFFLF
jgi:hypothetical protein